MEMDVGEKVEAEDWDIIKLFVYYSNKTKKPICWNVCVAFTVMK